MLKRVFYVIEIVLVIFLFHITGYSQQDIVNGNLIQFNDNGAWCWYQDERAVIDKTNNKLIISSNRTSNGHDYVDIYNISNGTIQNYDLGSIGSDDHNTPGLLVRSDGKYLAVFARHNNDKISHYRIFNNGVWSADQTFNWNTQPGGADFNTTYSNLYYLSAEDRTYNISRGHGHGGQNFLISTDQGDTWSYGGFLTTNANVGYVNGYFKYCSNGVDRIDFICTEYHPRDFNTSIYHGYIKNGQTFKSDGTLVDSNIFDKNPSAPQSYTSAFQANTVINGITMTHCWNTDVQRYSDGTIATIITARTNTDSNNPTHAFIYCRFNGASWTSTYLSNAGLKLYNSEQDYTGLAAMQPNTPNIIYISSTYNPSDNTLLTKHEIFKGVLKDSGATWEWIPITQNSTVDNLRPIVPVWEDYKTALIWFRGTYYTAQNINAQIVGIITDETNTVPVELTSFSARFNGKSVELNWETKTEVNNKGFEIERRLDNGNWHVIGFVKGNGTTTNHNYYSFEDNSIDALVSLILYRLKQINLDGSFEYSNVVEVSYISFLDFSLEQNYPNPFNPTTKISWQSPVNGWQTLNVYDVLGNEIATLVDEFRPAGKYEVEFSADGRNLSGGNGYFLPSGVYFYQLKSNDPESINRGGTKQNFVASKKMMIVK